jgi:SAM-dependent methyltransferase
LVQRYPAIGTALEIGCNTGELVHALRSLNIEAYGVDISEKAISYAGESVQEYLSPVDVDFEPIPFSDKRFDLVIAHQVLQHLQRPGKLISEMYRVLKPCGIAFIMTPTPPLEARWWRTLRVQCDIEHINDHSKRVWIKTFELNGFRYIGHLQRVIQKAAYFNVPEVCRKRGLSAPSEI